MNSKKIAIAFFDFDGTISNKDSFLAFIKFTHNSLQLALCMLMNAPYIVLFYLKLFPNQKLKERFFSFFYKGQSAIELLKYGEKFGEQVLPDLCYETAINRIKWHQAQGHEIYILTASSDIWLGEWCKKLNLNFIGTEFEVQNGRYTGKIKGENCYGIEKIKRIQPLLEKYQATFGYGDSVADIFFLKEMDFSFNKPLNTDFKANNTPDQSEYFEF